MPPPLTASLGPGPVASSRIQHYATTIAGRKKKICATTINESAGELLAA